MTRNPEEAVIRVLSEGDLGAKRATRPLYEQAFDDPEDFVDYYYADKCADNRMVIAESPEGKLLSMAHLNPYTLCVMGHAVKSAYIVAVATDRAHRHKGLMTQVLSRVFTLCASEHMPLIWLLPVDPAIYTPSGFEVICDYQKDGSLPYGEVRASCDIYCLRDRTYLRRQAIEEKLDGEDASEALPADPKIMMKVTDPAALRGLLPDADGAGTLYDALRRCRCYFREEV